MLELTGMTVRYGATLALRDVRLSVRDGQFIGILGANGAGKTTLLRTISGLVKPVAGSMVLDGRNLSGRSPEAVVRDGIVHVPEGRGIFPDLTVRENLLVGAYTRRDRSRVAGDYAAILAAFPLLAQRERQDGSTLSGGEQQMLAIGRALMARPRILLADEVSLGLAPGVTRQVFAQLKRLHREGLTLIVVEQNANLVLKAADFVYVLKQGRVVLEGSREQLSSRRELTAAYLGV